MSQNWYLLAFGVELGPMTWEDLCALAQQRTVRGDTRVRCGDAAWLPAASVAGLLLPVAAEDRSKVAATQAAYAPAAPVVESPSPQPRESRPTVQDVAVIRALHAAGTSAPCWPAPRTTLLAKTDKRPIVGDKTAGRSFAGPLIRLRVSGKLLMASASLLVVASMGFGGWAYRKSRTPGPNYEQVAAVYRQVYEQIKLFRRDPRRRSPVGLQFQFSRRVGAFRAQLQKLPDDDSASQLAEAGSQLSEMLANCQATRDLAEQSKFVESEQRFLSIIDKFNKPSRK